VRILAENLEPGMVIPGLDNAYIIDVDTGKGYLTYPSTGSGYDAAMPDDTIVVTFHDREGEENYLLLNPRMPLEVNE